MSEYINNATRRRETLKRLILDLHAGRPVDEVKREFAAQLGNASAAEIAELEQALIAEGLPESEIKLLCDVHVAVFRESLDTQARPETVPGHPIFTFRAENLAVGRILDGLREALNDYRELPMESTLTRLRAQVAKLREYEKHYLRKELLLFPYLEKHDFYGPSAVMWAIHDDIRRLWKELETQLTTEPVESASLLTLNDRLELLIREMIYKEEAILFPNALERLTEEEWGAIRAQEAEIGYAYVLPGRQWAPRLDPRTAEATAPVMPPATITPTALLPLETGALTLEQIQLLLTTLPVDVTLVDEHDEVRFYSQTPDRIFPRTPAVVGRKVQQCHPPESVHRVQQILDDFRAGTRQVAEFWIQLNGRFIHIRYFPLRDAAGAYRGTLEVTQDITSLRTLQGERRLL